MNKENNVIFSGKKTSFKINFIKLAFLIFVFAVIVLAFYALIPLISAFIIAFIISYLIGPVLEFFEGKHIPRLFIIILIFILIIILFAFLITLVKMYFPKQDDILRFKETAMLNLNNLKIYLSQQIDFVHWDEIFTGIQTRLDSEFSITKKLPPLISSLPGMFSLIIIVPFLVFFFLLNGRDMKKKFLSIIPNKYFEMTLITIAEIDNIIGKYIRGTLLESLIVGLLTSFGFYVMGFPPTTAFISGMIAGLANAIPYLGPIIGAIIGVSICILNLVPLNYVNLFGLQASVIGVIVVVIIAQIIDQIIIQPSIIGKSVDLHPILIIIGVIAGSNLFGFIGMLIAIPLLAIIKVVIVTLYKHLKDFQLLKDNLFSIIIKNAYYSDEGE